MLKLLYKAFPRQFNKLAFNSQSKPVDKSLLEFCFIDSNGYKYYRYSDDFEIPISRKGHFEKCFLELESCLSGSELQLLLDAMEKALAEKDRQGNMKPNIALMGHLVTEIKNRKQLLLHPDIMMDMVACLYIREDENPATIDLEIHTYKVEQFKADSRGGLYDFFYSAGLSKYLPYLEKSAEDWGAIFEYSRARITAMNQQMEAYTSAGESVST